MLAFGKWSEELPEQCKPREITDASNTKIPIIPQNVLNLHLLYTSLLLLLSRSCDNNEERRSFFHTASRKGYHIADMLENVSINTTLSRMLPTLELLTYLMSIPAQVLVPCGTGTLTIISHALVDIGFNASNEDIMLQSAQEASGAHDVRSCGNRSFIDGVTIPNHRHTVSSQLPGDERATVASLDVHSPTAGLNSLDHVPQGQHSDRLAPSLGEGKNPLDYFSLIDDFERFDPLTLDCFTRQLLLTFTVIILNSKEISGTMLHYPGISTPSPATMSPVHDVLTE